MTFKESAALLFFAGFAALVITGGVFTLTEKLTADLSKRQAELDAQWVGAELVRICGGGAHLYRDKHGRLMTYRRGTVYFAHDITPEQACGR